MGRNLRSHRGRFVRDSERAGPIDRHSAEGELSPQQKAEIEERPTQNLDAFELYLQAKPTIDSYINATDVRAALLQALNSLDEAIQRDPNFVSAYCYVARANDLLFLFDLDPTPERISLADEAVKQRSVFAPIQLKRISPGPIISSGVSATTIVPWKNSQSRGRVCRTAHLFYSLRLH